MAKTSKRTAGRAKRAWRPHSNALVLLTITALAAPAAAESVFEQLYPASKSEVKLPAPFAALLDDIRKKTGNAQIRTAFIPLGRSLQRMAADPDFFGKPRIIAAVTSDGESPMPVRNRLYLGYQAASGLIEIISFDEAKGRFVFQEVTGYEGGKPGTIQNLEDQACNACHQANGPILAASPWSESNANPAVVAVLPSSYEGLAIKQDFDGIDQLNRSVRRAARIEAGAELWLEGCQSRLCRGALLAEVLRYKLAPQPLAYEVKDTSFIADLTAAWPGGLSFVTAKIPDRDPLSLVAAGARPGDVIETKDAFNPETERLQQIVWPSGLERARAAVQLVSEFVGPREVEALAAQLPPNDPEWLADRVRKIAEDGSQVAMLDGALPAPSSLETLFALIFASRVQSAEVPQ